MLLYTLPSYFLLCKLYLFSTFLYFYHKKTPTIHHFFVWINQKNFYASVFEGTLYT